MHVTCVNKLINCHYGKLVHNHWLVYNHRLAYAKKMMLGTIFCNGPRSWRLRPLLRHQQLPSVTSAARPLTDPVTTPTRIINPLARKQPISIVDPATGSFPPEIPFLLGHHLWPSSLRPVLPLYKPPCCLFLGAHILSLSQYTVFIREYSLHFINLHFIWLKPL